MCPCKNLYTSVHSRIAHNNQKGETTQMLINRRMDKQNETCLCEFSSSTGVGSHSLLRRIFLTQGLNTGFLRSRQILYHLRHKTSPPEVVDIYSEDHTYQRWHAQGFTGLTTDQPTSVLMSIMNNTNGLSLVNSTSC